MDIEELEDIVAWNLSFNIPVEETLKEFKITDPEIINLFLENLNN